MEMSLAKRAKSVTFWKCEWVSYRWYEIKTLEWNIMLDNIPWMNTIDKIEFEQACDDIQIGVGQIPALHKNILLGD